MKTDFTKLRRKLDDAITYADFETAILLSQDGLQSAQYQENLGEIMYFKAQREIIAENYPTAFKFLGQAIQYNPSDGAAYNDRALCAIELNGNEEQALADFDKGIEVEPDYATIYHNKGWYLNKLGRHQEAIRCFDKALELEPKRAVTYENLADAYLHLGSTEKAVEAFRQALKFLNPDYIHIRQQIEAKIELLRN